MSPSVDSARHMVASAEVTREPALALLDATARIEAEPATCEDALAGRVVANVFFEPSTRTRLAFELAARRLGATVLTSTKADASAMKGESLEDTFRTLQALGIDALVLRHSDNGAARRAAELIEIPVVNAGDGSNDHPTQALVDAHTLRAHFGRIEGLRVVISGDVLYARGAHASATLLRTLGADVTLVAPPELQPPSHNGLPMPLGDDLDAAIEGCHAVLMQRVQVERHGGALAHVKDDVSARYELTAERVARMAPDGVVMHPGPMNRGVEISSEVADGPRSLVLTQVRHAVPVRMAVLLWVFGLDPLA